MAAPEAAKAITIYSKPKTALEALHRYTAGQESRIMAFAHMVTLASTLRPRIQAGEKLNYIWTDPKGYSQSLFKIDLQFVESVEQAAFHMYDFELRLKPETKAAADDILQKVRAEKREREDGEKAKLRRMWETTY